jgi:hypothetical protein
MPNTTLWPSIITPGNHGARVHKFRLREKEFFILEFTIPQALRFMIITSAATKGCKQPFGSCVNVWLDPI